MRIADYIDNEVSPMADYLIEALSRIEHSKLITAFPVVANNPEVFYAGLRAGLEMVRSQMGNTPIIPEQIRSIDQEEFMKRIFRESEATNE